MSNGESIPNTHKITNTQQTGVENNIEGSPFDNNNERLKPFSPIGPNIIANTIAALFIPNLRANQPITPNIIMITTSTKF